MSKKLKISVVGGGPGGLYFSILTKTRLPNSEINVYEQNSYDDAFGFGVVFSDETLSEFLSYDLKSYELIRKTFSYWDNLDIVRNQEKVRIIGNGFCGCSRKTLLLLLQKRAKEEGVILHFNTRIEQLEQFSDSDIILAADGINSKIRTDFESEFEPSIDLQSNRFVWCGSTKPLDAFTYFFKDSPHGAFCAHTYQYEKGHTTWIFECRDETFQKAKLDVMDEKGTVKYLEGLYKEELGGHKLITNHSYWRQFPHIENKKWYHKNIVLLGDAKATAHYSIGSGTKLSMDCAIALSNAVVDNQNDIQKAFHLYERERREPVSMIQHAAKVSLNWFEAMDRHMKLDFNAFSFSVMSRSKKITIENQARRDKDYTDRLITSFNKKHKNEKKYASPAFTPFKIGHLFLSNRIVMSAMGQYNATNGIAGDWHFVHYTSRAIGGVGLIFTEMTAIAPKAKITPYDTGIWNKEQVLAWKKITDFIHSYTDTKIGIQLGHCGRKGNCETIKNGKMIPFSEKKTDLVSVSPIAFNTEFPSPRELTVLEMDEIVNDFKKATQNALKAGFDIIELQAHHGFLLASFISPLTNQRNDEYGGALKNRIKFPLRVLDALFSETKGKIPISVRTSATDWAKGGLSLSEAIQVSEMFSKAGADIINVSTGNTVENQKPFFGRMWQTPYSEAIKTETGIPTITTGHIQDIDQINTLLLSERADLVALGRPLLLDPYFVRKAQAYENCNQASIPIPYEAGISHLFSYEQKKRTELENMKQSLKPKSHQLQKEPNKKIIYNDF